MHGVQLALDPNLRLLRHEDAIYAVLAQRASVSTSPCDDDPLPTASTRTRSWNRVFRRPHSRQHRRMDESLRQHIGMLTILHAAAKPPSTRSRCRQSRGYRASCLTSRRWWNERESSSNGSSDARKRSPSTRTSDRYRAPTTGRYWKHLAASRGAPTQQNGGRDARRNSRLVALATHARDHSRGRRVRVRLLQQAPRTPGRLTP